MKKKIDTGRIKTVKIYRYERYCDKCGKRLGMINPAIHYSSGGERREVCKKGKCNPFKP